MITLTWYWAAATLTVAASIGFVTCALLAVAARADKETRFVEALQAKERRMRLGESGLWE